MKSEAHLPDPGNAIARLKSYVDGLQDAGVFVNDKHVDITLERRCGKDQGVMLTISEVT
jgi:Holliday junction resolvase RusA-like endonuclease